LIYFKKIKKLKSTKIIKFVGCLKFVKIREFVRFIKFIKFEYSNYGFSKGSVDRELRCGWDHGYKCDQFMGRYIRLRLAIWEVPMSLHFEIIREWTLQQLKTCC